MARTARRRKATGPGWLRRMFGWVVRAFFVFVIGSLLWVLLYRFVPPPFTFTMAGDLVGGHGVNKDWVSLDRVDRDMVRAAIAAEDSKFCSHNGFDQDAIAEAMRRNAKGGSVMRGGSTISQQTAKNAFLWQGGGYFRKGLEAWFTLLIENLWGKRRIMEVYLNVAETGIGTYGVNAGAERYFGHDASNLSRIEAARIAAILPLPKKRGAVAPKGFTRSYGNSIERRVGIVSRDRLDACVYDGAASPQSTETPERSERPSRKQSEPQKTERPPQQPEELPTEIPGDEYEQQSVKEEAEVLDIPPPPTAETPLPEPAIPPQQE